MSNNPNYPVQIAVGWVQLLLVAAITLLLVTMESSMVDNNFEALKTDPGLDGIPMLIVLFTIYALMPIVVFFIASINFPLLRWITVIPAAFSVLFMAIHHTSHILYEERTTVVSNFLDIVLHLIGLRILYCSIRWAIPAKKNTSEKASTE